MKLQKYDPERILNKIVSRYQPITINLASKKMKWSPDQVYQLTLTFESIRVHNKWLNKKGEVIRARRIKHLLLTLEK